MLDFGRNNVFIESFEYSRIFSWPQHTLSFNYIVIYAEIWEQGRVWKEPSGHPFFNTLSKIHTRRFIGHIFLPHHVLTNSFSLKSGYFITFSPLSSQGTILLLHKDIWVGRWFRKWFPKCFENRLITPCFHKWWRSY